MSPSTRTVRSGVRCAASRRASASVVRTHNPRRYASAARFSSTLGLPYAVGASVAEGGKRPVMLLTSDSAFLFHIAELETAARQNLPLVCVVGVDHQWGLEVGVYKRTFEQPSPQPGVHWSKDVRFDKIAEGFGCHGEYVEKEDEMGPAIERAYASGKTAVVHVCIDPKANSEEMPKYDEFRTWYAEGTQ